MARTDKQMNVRLPPDCTAFVADQAARDACSMNSVVVRAIRMMLDAQKANRPGAATPDRSEVSVSR